MKYMPTLRLRGEERMAIRELDLDERFMPLIEILQEKPDKRFKGDFQEVNLEQLSYINTPFLVDIPIYFSITPSTKDPIASFIGQAQREDDFIINKYLELSQNDFITPVISYNPNDQFYPGRIKYIKDKLDSSYDKFAYRIHYKHFENHLEEIKDLITEDDILIFDIKESSEFNSVFKTNYNKINTLKKELNFKTILLKSSLPDELTNVGLDDNVPIPEANNSILNSYKDFGFNGFGDYAGVKKDKDIRDGGTISPGFIFYYKDDNLYVGYGHRVKKLSEFKEYIIPTLFESRYWNDLSDNHKENCPGCSQIINIKEGNESGKHQGKWKRISLMHYVYTLRELL